MIESRAWVAGQQEIQGHFEDQTSKLEPGKEFKGPVEHGTAVALLWYASWYWNSILDGNLRCFD
jgi:hypothetical protein